MNEIYKIPYFVIIILCSAITVKPKIEIIHLILPLLIFFVFYKNEDTKYTTTIGLTLFLICGTRKSIMIMNNPLSELGDLNTYIEAIKQGMDFPISMLFYKLFAYGFGEVNGLKILINILFLSICSLYMLYAYKNNNQFIFTLTPVLILCDPAFDYVMKGMIRNLIGLTIITGYLTLSNKTKIHRMLISVLLSFTHLMSLTWYLCIQITEGIININKKIIYSFIPIIISIPILICLGTKSGLLNASIDRWIRFSFYMFFYSKTKFKYFKFDFANLSLWPIALLSMIGLLTIKFIEQKNKKILLWILMLLIPFFPLMKNVYSWRLIYISCIPLLNSLNEINFTLMDKRIITSYAFLNINSPHITISQIIMRILNPNLSLIINIIFVFLFHINLFLPKKVFLT
ncbi:MAG: hypothetical protein ACFFDN_32360 [Candidatus Hodarchaeota archaeon]